MCKKTAVCCLFILLLSSGCVPTLSTNFESARLLQPKTFEMQGYGSRYFGVLNNSINEEWGPRTNNYGLSLAYGLSSKIRLRARIESIDLKDRAEFFYGPILPSGSRVHYAEIGLKYGWNQHKNIRTAISLPLGVFSHGADALGYIIPTFYASYSKNDTFEIGINGKLHYWFNESVSIPWFSTGMVVGVSSNVNKWCLRSEINTDIYNISVGVGFAYTISPSK